MATIRKRGASWHAQVRRCGLPSLTKSFARKEDAQAWARAVEAQIDAGDQPASRSRLKHVGVGEVLRRYEAEVTPLKRGASSERYRLRVLLRSKLADTRLDKLSSAHVAEYRDERLQEVKAATVRRELAILHHALEVARYDWGIPLSSNPVSKTRLPQGGERSAARVDGADLDKIIEQADRSRLWYIKPAILLAIETGMRRGEILSLMWEHVDLKRKVAFLPLTKNGEARNVPLSDLAISVIEGIPRNGTKLFDITPNAFRLAWERLRSKAGTPNVRFHDFRHEAVSRFFEKGLQIPEVSLISGHKDMRMLARYTHLKAEEIAKRLR